MNRRRTGADDPPEEIAIPGVSPRVRRGRGTGRAGGRVIFRSDGRAAASERVVMHKCRRAGYKCYRLSPATWRALGRFEQLVGDSLTPEEARAAVARELKPATLPRLEALKALLAFLPPDVRHRIVARHTQGDVDPRRPGVPDLLVHGAVGANGSPGFVAFVEVKRPGERVGEHQRTEIAFLRSLGLQAGVFRLVERQSTTKGPTQAGVVGGVTPRSARRPGRS